MIKLVKMLNIRALSDSIVIAGLLAFWQWHLAESIALPKNGGKQVGGSLAHFFISYSAERHFFF